MISLFTVKLEHSIKDDERWRSLVRWLTRLSYILPTIVMGVAILMELNGLCFVFN